MWGVHRRPPRSRLLEEGIRGRAARTSRRTPASLVAAPIEPDRGRPARRPVVGARRPRRGNAPMSEPKTIRVKDGGFVSLERGPDEKGWTRLEVATADRTVALGVILTSDEAVRSVISYYGWRAVRSRTGRSGPRRSPGRADSGCGDGQGRPGFGWAANLEGPRNRWVRGGGARDEPRPRGDARGRGRRVIPAVGTRGHARDGSRSCPQVAA